MEQRNSLGPQHHHAVVSLTEFREPVFLAGCQPTPPAFLDQGLEEDAILNGRLTVTHPPEGVVVKGIESVEQYLQVDRQHGRWADGGGQGKTGLLLQRTPMLLGTLLQLKIDLGREVKSDAWPGHPSLLLTYPFHSSTPAASDLSRRLGLSEAYAGVQEGIAVQDEALVETLRSLLAVPVD